MIGKPVTIGIGEYRWVGTVGPRGIDHARLECFDAATGRYYLATLEQRAALPEGYGEAAGRAFDTLLATEIANQIFANLR